VGRALLSDSSGVATALAADVVGSVAHVFGAAMMPVLAAVGVVRVSLAPVDFRLGMDGLSLRAQAVVGASVFSDTFVFFNRGLDKVKILRYDRHGFWLCYQRLARGRFVLPGKAALDGVELGLLLEGIDLSVRRLLPVLAKRLA
jgi:transposase